MKRHRHEGEMMPRGYRIAYMDHMRRRDVCYPIGIHLIARLIRRIHEWSYRYRPSAMERMVSKAVCNARWEAQMERDKESATRCAQCTYPLGGRGDGYQRIRALLHAGTPQAEEATG